MSFSVISVSSSFHARRKRAPCVEVYMAGPFQVQSGVVRPFDVTTKRQIHAVLTVNKESTIQFLYLVVTSAIVTVSKSRQSVLGSGSVRKSIFFDRLMETQNYCQRLVLNLLDHR